MPPSADTNLTRRSRPRTHGLRRRILIALLVVFMLGFANLAVHLYGTRDELRRAVLLIQAQAVSEGLSSVGDLAALPRQYAGSELGYTLYSADGRLLWFSDNLERPRRLRADMLEPRSSWWRWSPYGGNVVNAPVRLADGAILMVSKNDAAERAMIDSLLKDRLRQSLVAMLPLGLLSVGLILLLLNWTLRPVRQAARLARGIGPEAPNGRIPLDDLPNEVHPLADAANCALDRLATAYDAERRFVADAAHELRTPLTVLDLRLQQARRCGSVDWQALDGEMRQMRRLVGQLLALARQDGIAALPQSRGPCNLSRVVREAAASILPLVEARQRHLRLELEERVRVTGDPDLLREALGNLLENALVHGEGEIVVRVWREGSDALVDIGDQGAGVPAVEQEAMFQRFRKGRPGSEGTGLGLAIVRQIVRNHGGSVGFVGPVGNRLRIRLPLAGSEADALSRCP